MASFKSFDNAAITIVGIELANRGDTAQRALPAPFRQPQTGNSLFTTGRPAGVNAGTSWLGVGTVDFSNAFLSTDEDRRSGKEDCYASGPDGGTNTCKPPTGHGTR
jgi:hypothetical protein